MIQSKYKFCIFFFYKSKILPVIVSDMEVVLWNLHT